MQYGEDYEGLGKEVVLVTPMLALSPAGEDYMTGSSKAPQASWLSLYVQATGQN